MHAANIPLPVTYVVGPWIFSTCSVMVLCLLIAVNYRATTIYIYCDQLYRQ